ncbi:MAG: histidinol-phosphatase HisJ family protein [Sphaerobacter sp.]|nr:histidinol-phosphatase HisJ family protein [Sphaerobacter sp.]
MSSAVIPQDYHVHTRFSFDGRLPLDAVCEAALARGILEVCTTDHADFVPGDAGCGYFQPAAFFAELEQCRARYDGRLTLRAGVEIGEAHRYPAEVARLTAGFPFDFVIGSLHYVGDDFVMTPRYFAERSAREAYTAYFTELLALARAGDFDVLGHLDVPKRYGVAVHGPFDERDYEEEIRAVLRACIERGIGIEINTGTTRRAGVPSPGPEALRWYREMGGEILTIGSDAHRAEHIGYELAQAVALARAAGFTHLTRFEARQPRFIPLP